MDLDFATANEARTIELETFKHRLEGLVEMNMRANMVDWSKSRRRGRVNCDENVTVFRSTKISPLNAIVL